MASISFKQHAALTKTAIKQFQGVVVRNLELSLQEYISQIVTTSRQLSSVIVRGTSDEIRCEDKNRKYLPWGSETSDMKKIRLAVDEFRTIADRLPDFFYAYGSTK